MAPFNDRGEELIESLITALASLEKSTSRLASKEYVEQAQIEERRRRKNFGTLVVAVGGCFLVIFGVLLVGLAQITALADDTNGNTGVIIDCLQPSTDTVKHACSDLRMDHFEERMRDAVEPLQEQIDDLQRRLFATQVK